MASEPEKPGTAEKKPDETDEESEKKRLDFFREAFQSTLGAFNNADEEAHALIARLVSLGRLSRDEGTRMFGDVRQLVEQRRNEVEEQIQTAIRTTMTRLTIPTQEDIAEAAQKIAELERRVEALGDLEPRREIPRTPVARRPGQSAPDVTTEKPARKKKR